MPVSDKPHQKDDPMYQLLLSGSIAEFNERREKGESCDLRSSDLRTRNLKGLDAKGLDLSDCYLRQADLRGVDFRETNLEGASINSAKISGAYFPDSIGAEEIRLSLMHGTRLRQKNI
ncbi:MAG: pentapeptide repeat-containing protein [Gammaproteobacteria bacterium]